MLAEVRSGSGSEFRVLGVRSGTGGQIRRGVRIPARESSMLARMNDPSEAARALSALGASKGGRARAARLTPEERSRIARSGANARWGRNASTPSQATGREYAIVTPEVKAWMDADPRVAAMLAELCASPVRDAVMSDIKEMLR